MAPVDYICDDCGVVVEAENGSDPACAACGKSMRKVWKTAPGIRFKGQGFYVNDYRRKSK